MKLDFYSLSQNLGISYLDDLFQGHMYNDLTHVVNLSCNLSILVLLTKIVSSPKQNNCPYLVSFLEKGWPRFGSEKWLFILGTTFLSLIFNILLILNIYKGNWESCNIRWCQSVCINWWWSSYCFSTGKFRFKEAWLV